MSRRVATAAALFVAGLAAAPVAAAGGPMPFASQGGSGVAVPNGSTRLVAVGAGAVGVAEPTTALEVIQTNGGAVQYSTTLAGSWGVPVVTYTDSSPEGLSADGKTLVLGDVAVSYPRVRSEFLVVDTKSLRIKRTITLEGDFSYDALSPDATRLYLIQHVDQTNAQRYVVRGYDLVAGRLLPGRIADRTQKSWVMQGYPISRTTSTDGRFVYTLYQNPGGYPFVHALDTKRGVAHCVGLPWKGAQNAVYNMRLSLRANDRVLAVHWLSGRPWLTVDTNTWRITQDRRAGFPWLGIGAGAGTVVAVGGAFLLRSRRRRGEELEQELAELLGLSQREVVV
jgi:hypothetical protein